MKTIAVDIDDTLNNFSEILRGKEFVYSASYPFSGEIFGKYLEMVRNEIGSKEDLCDPQFSYLRQRINGECYENAEARADAVEFIQWLRNQGWRIVICTHRDLRRTEEITRKWLGDNGIPFDYLFIAVDKLAFCKAWGIEYLLDDHLFSVKFADQYGVRVFYPIMAKHQKAQSGLARGFMHFDEVREWIQKPH